MNPVNCPIKRLLYNQTDTRTVMRCDGPACGWYCVDACGIKILALAARTQLPAGTIQALAQGSFFNSNARTAPPEYISQALNEGDGVYRP